MYCVPYVLKLQDNLEILGVVGVLYKPRAYLDAIIFITEARAISAVHLPTFCSRQHSLAPSNDTPRSV